MTKKNQRPAIEIRPHPRSDEHWYAIVTTARGYCYFDVWAGRPSEEKVLQAWHEDRRNFLPYDCTRGI